MGRNDHPFNTIQCNTIEYNTIMVFENKILRRIFEMNVHFSQIKIPAISKQVNTKPRGYNALLNFKRKI